jgi:hypothetical protein
MVPREMVKMVSQGMESLYKLVQEQPGLSLDTLDTESAYATTNSKDCGWSRGRSKGHRKMDKKTMRKLPSPSTSRSPTPPLTKGRSSSQRCSKSSGRKTDEDRKRNPAAANTAPNTAAMDTYTQHQRTSPTTNATSTRSSKDGGKNGCAKSWKSHTKIGTNLIIDGVGIGMRWM